MTRKITHWIDGNHVERPGRLGEVFDPATGELAAHVSLASADVVDEAVGRAGEAFDQWRRTSLAARTQVMFAFREILRRRGEELAEIITAEHGKVLADARGEIARGLEVVEFACGIPHLLKGEFSENVSTGIDSYSMRQPLGVVAVISPFNFPAMVPMWFFPIALASGNTVILKPSEKDPGAANWLAAALAESGLPAGVFNVVHGDAEAVNALLDHDGVHAVSFVGSTPVARHVYARCSATGKRVQALGGAKNHMVVLPDADLDLAADGAVGAAFGSAGERCMAVSVVVAVEPVADGLIARVRDRIDQMRVGDGRDPKSEMGPLITLSHRDRVAQYLESGAAAGAQLVVDGRNASVEGAQNGYWLGPSMFDRVTREMDIYTDEIFGPVLSVMRAQTFDEALEVVNGNQYGNGAVLYTNDGRAARRFQSAVSVGMVGINVPVPVPMAYYSFGGWKSSLFGDSRAHGQDGVNFYTRSKVTTARWPDSSHGGVRLGFPTN